MPNIIATLAANSPTMPICSMIKYTIGFFSCNPARRAYNVTITSIILNITNNETKNTAMFNLPNLHYDCEYKDNISKHQLCEMMDHV